VTVQRRAEHARAELAELRKELADTKAQLALQSANTVEAMQQRNAAQAERDALRMTRARGCQCGDADVCAVIHEMSIERDSLRAQVAELRGAVLDLGELVGVWDDARMDYVEVQVDKPVLSAWNALVARLRAEAPAQGKEEQ
jgi:replicative DNA helicase